MIGKEIILATLRGDVSDRVPIFEAEFNAEALLNIWKVSFFPNPGTEAAN